MSARAGAAAGLFLIAACAASLAHPGPDEALRAGVSVERLEADRAVYVSKCAGCHALHLPSDLPEARWPAEVSDMAEKARLAADDRLAIERFLVAMARSGADAGTPRPRAAP